MTEPENISEELFESIESYLAGKMSARQQVEFETEIARNATLAEEVERQRLLVQAVELGALRSELDTIHLQRKPRVIILRRIAAAAVLVGLLFTAVWIYSGGNREPDLFALHAIPDPGLAVPMSSTGNYAFYDAMVDYKNEKYGVAITKWKSSLQADPVNDTLLYYIGSAFFNLSQMDSAAFYYDRVLIRPSSVFHDKAEWYRALVAYREKDVDRLDEIMRSANSTYKSKIRLLHESIHRP